MKIKQNQSIGLPVEAADAITAATLKDWHDYLVYELKQWENNPKTEENPDGYWLHPEDVVLNQRYITALKLIIPAFGGRV